MVEEFLAHLGIKVTKQRKVVIEILEKAKEPITAEDIYDQVEDKEILNYSTVYRTLNTLSEKGALIKTGDPGGKMYFQLKGHHHSHELECMACHKHIQIDACPVEAFSRALSKETGFVVMEHSLQIKGLCAECAAHKSESQEGKFQADDSHNCISHSE